MARNWHFIDNAVYAILNGKYEGWAAFRLSWGVPAHQTIDEFVCDEIEGRGHKFVRPHRNIEARY